jgi:hypothetical protein
MRAEPIAKQQMALRFFAFGPDVNVRGAVRRAKHRVAGLVHNERVARMVQCRANRCIVRLHALDDEVDHRFCRQSRYGGGADVFDARRASAESRGNALAMRLELLRPRRIVRSETKRDHVETVRESSRQIRRASPTSTRLRSTNSLRQ